MIGSSEIGEKEIRSEGEKEGEKVKDGRGRDGLKGGRTGEWEKRSLVRVG